MLLKGNLFSNAGEAKRIEYEISILNTGKLSKKV